MKSESKKARGIVIWFMWLVIWQILSLMVNNDVLLASPVETLRALKGLILEEDFGIVLLASSLKLSLGFVLGLLIGGVLGCLGAQKRWIDEALRPILTFMKSVPVAAFVVLLLVWWGSKWLSVAIVFVVVFPHIYMSFYDGLAQTDVQMVEVAKVFEIDTFNKIFYLYRTALKPFMGNALKLTLGLSWKSGVAAEVIGTPDYSIGEALYMAKTHLNTSEVFAWIVVILILSALFEKGGLWLFERFCNWRPRCKEPMRKKKMQGQILKYFLSKSYGEHVIWDEFYLELEKGKIYTIQAPSGRGKTTLLRLLAGLEKNEAEEANEVTCSMLFQEDRLFPEETPLTNIEFCIGSNRRQEIRRHLQALIPELEEHQTCQMLSGGMKRRVGLVRAMMADGELVLLDEPFTGLDDHAKRQMVGYILDMQQGRTIVVVSHHEKDGEMLNSVHWKM